MQLHLQTHKFWSCLLGVILLVACTGCSTTKSDSQVAASKLPEGFKASETVNISVSKSKLNESLQKHPELNRIRMVDVFRQGAIYPEYHLFDIQDRSAYSMLGLQNRDVLIAANDFIVYNKTGFPRFVGLLPTADKASIVVRRGEKDLKFQYEITAP